MNINSLLEEPESGDRVKNAADDVERVPTGEAQTDNNRNTYDEPLDIRKATPPEASQGTAKEPDSAEHESARTQEGQVQPPSAFSWSREESSTLSAAPSLISGSTATLPSQTPGTPSHQASGTSQYTIDSHGHPDHDGLPPQTGRTSYPEHDAETQEDIDAVAQAEEGGSIVVDSDDVGTDAGYESDTRTSASTSMASSVRDYAFENGRRYHKFREGRYNFPNDDVEQEREDMKHAMVKMLCQQLHFAPIGAHPQEILDIGTGTGIWAIESEFLLFHTFGVITLRRTNQYD